MIGQQYFYFLKIVKGIYLADEWIEKSNLNIFFSFFERKMSLFCLSYNVLQLTTWSLFVFRMFEAEANSDTSSEKATDEDFTSEENVLIPDGGWGWVVCFAVFWLNFSVAGIGTSNGILLLGLTDLYNESISKAAMVGSIFLGALMSAGQSVFIYTFISAKQSTIVFASSNSSLQIFDHLYCGQVFNSQLFWIKALVDIMH